MTATSGPRRPGRLGVGVVGAGRVGAVLASALRAAGHTIVGASAISQASRDRVDTLLPGVPVLDIRDVVERAELVLLTVPDDVLAGLVEGLAQVGAWQPGQIVVHTSGRFGVDVLAPARAAGVIPVAMHPAMTFTGTSLDLGRLEGATFAVTAPGPVQPIGQALVVELGGEPVVIDERDRGLYHAALAHAANHLVVLVAQAAQALQVAGIVDPGRALAPLLHAALDGALRAADGVGDPIQTLTGPVVRADTGTVARHLEVLAALASQSSASDTLESYRTLSKAATVRALGANRLTLDQARELLDVLNTPDPPQET